jgi:hypothetical protein
MAVTVQFRSDVLVAGLIGLGGAENEPTTKDQGLRGGASPDEGLELLAKLRGKNDA